MIPKDKRLELNKMSKEVYGSESRWQKMLRGSELIASESKNKKGETIKVLNHKRPTLEELETEMKRAYDALQKEKSDARAGSETSPDPAGIGTSDSPEGTTVP